jgi:transcription antitermination factor NusG
MVDGSVLADPYRSRWFVLFVRSNQEKRTAARLAACDVQHFLPCYRSVRRWADRRVTLDMPLFPGYVFVHLPFLERAKVLTLPNVVSFVGGRNSPSVVSEEEINWIRVGIEHGNALPHPTPSAGDRVRIVAGALSGMEGILLRRQNNTRVVVCLDSISRSFVVEVSLDAIEPVPGPQADRQPAAPPARIA